jgi:hypothetical protein
MGKSREMTEIIAGNRNCPRGKRIPRVPSLTWAPDSKISVGLASSRLRAGERPQPAARPDETLRHFSCVELLFSRLVSSFVVQTDTFVHIFTSGR